MENGKKLHIVACDHDEQLAELQRDIDELRMQVSLLSGVIVVVTGLAGGIILAMG